MRLLFLSTEFPNPFDFAKATFNFELVRSLSHRHDVEVVAPIPWTERFFSRRQADQVAPAPSFAVTHPTFFYPPKIGRRHYDSFLWNSIRRWRYQLQNRPKPDCILSYWTHPDGAVAVRLAKEQNTRSIVMVGGSDILVLANEPSRRPGIRKTLDEADAVVTVSNDLQAHIRDLGIADDKIHVVRRGVDDTIFYPGESIQARKALGLPHDKQIGLFVGRLVDVKGLKYLLSAMAESNGTESICPEQFQLFLVGDGPLRQPLERQAQKLNIASRVHFLGKLPHSQLGTWYRAADVTLLPSLSEGIPNVLLESLACGTPFVASDVGGISEICSEQDGGYLVPARQPREIASAIGRLLRGRQPVVDTSQIRRNSDFTREMENIIRSVTSPTFTQIPPSYAMPLPEASPC